MKTIDDFAVAGQRVLVRDEFIQGKTLPGLAVLDGS
jgi:hypothetical protein